MASQYFSAHFGVSNTSRSTWFDPILGTDTKLFVDPFAIYKESKGFWASAHDEVIQYFQDAFELLGPVYDKPSSPRYRKVLHLMRFPEPKYFGLGYVSDGQGGAGTGMGLAQRMVDAMSLALDRGLSDLRHFEELALLVERVGPDRISDITCNILMRRFVAYTKSVCHKLEIPVEPLEVAHGAFDDQRLRWVTAVEDLPRNPVTGLPVLLAPKRFLRELPQLNADDWFDYNSAELRDDFNLDLNERLGKADIVRAARERPELIRKWSDHAGDREAQPYDVDTDPVGLHNWLELSWNYGTDNALSLATPPSTNDQMMDFIEECCKRFQHFIEQGAGWKLLRNDDTGRPKNEESIQLLFKGLVEFYCDAAGIRLDREVYLGRGPVDFIFTRTATLRVLLEIKKMSNSSYWDGLESQLTTYMTADRTRYGWYLPVRFGDTPNEKARHKLLAERVKDVRADTGFNIRALAVDARKPKSASRVRKSTR
jgi:hypothetical protein